VVQYDIDSDGCSFVKREYATPDQHLVNCVHTSWTSPIHGQYVATRALNTVIWKVDQSTSQLTLVCALHQGFGFPCAKELAWAPQQLILAVLQADRVLLWNAVLGGFHPVVLLWDLRPQMAGSAISGFNVAWSPDGRRLAITTVGGNVWVWDLPDLDHVCAEDLLTVDDVGYGMDVSGWGLFPQHHFRHEGNLIHGWVHWSHDGQLLAYGTFTTGVPIWHVETNQLVTCLPVKYSGLCWSPTCNRIALNVNGVPYLWG
jgi:WD40 repeat protein